MFYTEQKSKYINIYYKTKDMMAPELTYAEHPSYPNDYVCQISMVPTFEEWKDETDPVIVFNEVPDQQFPDASKRIFTFIVERSS